MSADTIRRFESILSPQIHDERPVLPEDVLQDLALNQVFARIDEGAPTAKSAFREPLGSVPEVKYRQAVFQALDRKPLRSAVENFLRSIAQCDYRDDQAAHARYAYEAELWHLRAVTEYVGLVEIFRIELHEALADSAGQSDGWDQLGRHVAAHQASPAFRALESEAIGLQEEVARVQYNALIRGPKVTVAQTDGEADLETAVLATFERFRQGDVADHRASFRAPGLDHVQASMLELAARVHPEPFAHLQRFAGKTSQYRDRLLVQFTDEVRFYLAYLDYLEPMRKKGLSICYPTMSSETKKLSVDETWDLALAPRLLKNKEDVVTNDLELREDERILVISGPNQGGKTTMARVFGQLHHLAAIGCPVPGSQAQMYLCDRVLTVFERVERLDTLEGRLGAEVQRLHQMFDEATQRSVIVINEAFASTALHDARILTQDVLERISTLDALAACVTFIDELSRLSDKTVSMVSMVDPEDPAVRTFRVERHVADGRAYARALAAKHGLTLDQIRTRLAAPTQNDKSAVPAGAAS